MREKSEFLDDILGKEFKVLNDGFVRVVDYMGTDTSIVNAARISYGKGTKRVSEDEGLIRYLMRHRHTTPTEMCEIKLHIRIPMDAWRQMVRHRMASINEYSTRYSEAIDSSQTTEPSEWRCQTLGNKQGSDGRLDSERGVGLSQAERDLQAMARFTYNQRLENGVAREQARKDLPLSTYTEAYWKIDLHNLLHFLALRMDSHAQKEIRDYATVIGEEIVARWVPLTWAAFNDYHPLRGGLTLSARDMAVVQALGKKTSNIDDDSWHANHVAKSFGWLERSKKTGKLKRNRERSECEEKLRSLGLEIPWQTL